MNAMQRGILLHRVLEYVWMQIGAQDTLHVALQSEHLEMQVWGHVDKVLEQYEQLHRVKIPQRLKALEVQRLVKLTMAWLRLESQRAPFRLNATEKETQIKIGDLIVNCRIDRIDEINNVGFAIIDYKSGNHGPGEWFGDAPSEPQMPIYALAEDLNIVAILYANLKPKAMGFRGIVQEDDLIPGHKAFDSMAPSRRYDLTWSELRSHWYQQLDRIGQEFMQGYAVPFQANGMECKDCDLHSLCRARALSSQGALMPQATFTDVTRGSE